MTPTRTIVVKLALAAWACGERGDHSRPTRIAEEPRRSPPSSTVAHAATLVLDGLAAPEAVVHDTMAGEVSSVVNGADILTPASIEYDRARGRMIIPLLKGDQLRIETWPTPP